MVQLTNFVRSMSVFDCIGINVRRDKIDIENSPQSHDSINIQLCKRAVFAVFAHFVEKIEFKFMFLEPVQQILSVLPNISGVIGDACPLGHDNNVGGPQNCFFHALEALYLHPFNIDQSNINNGIFREYIVD